ncbi:MAG TPA: ABC-type transport auxiliary lipoprotein family protein [Polyangiales bacterium]
MNSRSLTAWLGLAACSLLAACALFSKAAPLEPRYFTPEDGATAAVQRVAAQPASSENRQLRLGSVRGSSQLRERIVFRDSAHERGYYEDRRWTERPEAYLRRALARALFEERGLVRVVSGVGPTLEAELVAFEELRAPEHSVRVQVIITLDDDRTASLEETISVEQRVSPNAQDDAEATVAALASALQKCVAQIAERVVLQLGAAAVGRAPAPSEVQP